MIKKRIDLQFVGDGIKMTVTPLLGQIHFRISNIDGEEKMADDISIFLERNEIHALLGLLKGYMSE